MSDRTPKLKRKKQWRLISKNLLLCAFSDPIACTREFFSFSWKQLFSCLDLGAIILLFQMTHVFRSFTSCDLSRHWEPPLIAFPVSICILSPVMAAAHNQLRKKSTFGEREARAINTRKIGNATWHALGFGAQSFGSKQQETHLHLFILFVFRGSKWGKMKFYNLAKISRHFRSFLAVDRISQNFFGVPPLFDPLITVC